jgi:hydroxysqualene dehydroxylase
VVEDSAISGPPMTTDVVVIGAGFAGLSAAVRLAASGLTVAVVEEAPRLGGRATAFADRETGERVDNGQHVLFGCYRETYDFLRRIGTEKLAPLQTRLSLTLAAPNGRSFDLACPELPPPWHLLAAVLRWPAMPPRDRLSVLWLWSLLRQARREGAASAAAGVAVQQTVTDWLVAHRQSDELCRWLWRPLAIAALNQSPDVAAAAPFVRVLAELFGPKVEDSSVGLATVPLDELYAEPARRFVEAHGGRVLTRTPAAVVTGDDGRVAAVRAGAETILAPAVVSTVPWHALERIWEGPVPPAMASVVEAAARMGSSPIVTVNLWFDGPVTEATFIGLVDGPMHWVFDKSALFGERAGHLSVVASGADAIARLDNQDLTRIALEQLQHALAGVKSRRLVRAVVVREHRATFSLAPYGPRRPQTLTPIDGFYLAGDWTDTGLPATIEGAVQSGHRAADLIIEAFRSRLRRH